jgi:hypothetical protein
LLLLTLTARSPAAPEMTAVTPIGPEERYRVSLPQTAKPPEERYRVAPHPTGGIVDPRNSPAWRERDSKLTVGVMGTGIATGAAALGLLGSVIYMAAYKPPPGCCIDGFGGVMPFLVTAPLTLVGLIVLSGVAGARWIHRKPLRLYDPRFALTGLQIRF